MGKLKYRWGKSFENLLVSPCTESYNLIWKIMGFHNLRKVTSGSQTAYTFVTYKYDFFSRTAWWILMKLGRDEVLIYCFRGITRCDQVCQILRSAVLDDGDVACRWFEIWQRFIEGFYHIKTTACVWMYMYTCYMCIKTQYSYDKVI